MHHLETAVRAKALFMRDKQYVVRDGEVVIVDEFTGRMQPGRRWSDGLHQAVEAKEGVHVREESRTYASITFQNYFRQYEKLCGMTGTALTSSEEFYTVYGLEVVPVPTNRTIARNDMNDLIFQSEKQLKEFGEKLSEVNKTAIEGALAELKTAHESKDTAAIDTSLAALNAAWQNASQEMYNATQGAGTNEGPTGGENNTAENQDTVTDVDYEEVDKK